MAKLSLFPDDTEISVGVSESILTAVLRSGISHLHACGGVARCSTCRVEIQEGIENCAPVTDAEKQLLGKLNFPEHIRLACQTLITGPVTARRLLFDKRDLKLANQMEEQASGPVGSNRELAILFVDIEGFTPLSESLPTYDVMYILNRYFDMVGEAITANGGVINNYIGDAVLALFGLDDSGDEVFRAVSAGLDILRVAENVAETVSNNYNEHFHVRIGIHFGEAIIGMLGSAQDKRLSVIGESVNMASRIEAANKDAETRLLISENAFSKVEGRVEVEDFIRVKLKGMSSRSTLYEVSGLVGESNAGILETTRSVDGQQWQRVLPLKQLANGTKEICEIGESSILLINNDDRIYAIENNCPHMNMPLEMGQLTPEDSILCPFHDSEFCIRTGDIRKWVQQKDAPQLEENQQPLRTYPTDVIDDMIWICLES